jgi:hypothetical protein
MKAAALQQIQEAYDASRGDATALFTTVLAVAAEASLEEALEILEQCVVARRTAWLEQYGPSLERSGNTVTDGFKAFYGRYLGLTLPADGELVEISERRIVSRWRNPCPTLEACRKLGLDTRLVCRLVYEKPVEVLLAGIDPRLRFRRNYAALRPQTDYCEEIIELAG